MNRINKCFLDGKTKLITFEVLCDPDYQTSLDTVFAMIENGADIVELGLPFSDPIAEGNVIQKANERAIKSGYRLYDAFRFVKDIRKKYEIPLLFLTYFNVIYKYGVKDFLIKCKEIGIDGLIIPDLPYEEQDEIKTDAEGYGINIISLVSLTSQDRTNMIAKNADEFIYCVSSMGVTGERKKFSSDIFSLAENLSKITKSKKAVGFGITTPEQVKKFKEHFDGIIVGSAFVRLCENKDYEKIPLETGKFTKELKKALN